MRLAVCLHDESGAAMMQLLRNMGAVTCAHGDMYAGGSGSLTDALPPLSPSAFVLRDELIPSWTGFGWALRTRVLLCHRLIPLVVRGPRELLSTVSATRCAPLSTVRKAQGQTVTLNQTRPDALVIRDTVHPPFVSPDCAQTLFRCVQLSTVPRCSAGR